jgi:hypothetical protein
MKKDFESFRSCIEKYLAGEKILMRLSEAIEQADSTGSCVILEGHAQLALELIMAYFDDTSQWTSYWLYDLEQGKKWRKGMIRDKGDKDLPCKTIKDVWKLISTP